MWFAAQRFSIRQTPSLVFIKGGKTEGTVAGAISEGDFAAWTRYLVQGGPRPAVPTGTTDGVGPEMNGRLHTSPRKTGAAGQPLTLTDANFTSIINGAQPVLVDFWAPWCGPCRMVAPSVEKQAREFEGRAVVAKLNVDENPRTARHYNIMSIPALFIFKNGVVVDQIVGAQPEHVLRQRLAGVTG